MWRLYLCKSLQEDINTIFMSLIDIPAEESIVSYAWLISTLLIDLNAKSFRCAAVLLLSTFRSFASDLLDITWEEHLFPVNLKNSKVELNVFRLALMCRYKVYD